MRAAVGLAAAVLALAQAHARDDARPAARESAQPAAAQQAAGARAGQKVHRRATPEQIRKFNALQQKQGGKR